MVYSFVSFSSPSENTCWSYVYVVPVLNTCLDISSSNTEKKIKRKRMKSFMPWHKARMNY